MHIIYVSYMMHGGYRTSSCHHGGYHTSFVFAGETRGAKERHKALLPAGAFFFQEWLVDITLR